jgi:hypothetical protein
MSSDTTEAQKAADTDGPPPHVRRRRQREPLDFSPSSGPQGSVEKIRDVEDPISHDGRAKTKTTFYANQGGGDTDWDRLAKINDGLFDNDARRRGRDADRKRDLRIFSEVCELTDHQQKRSLYILDCVEDVPQYQSDEVLLLSIISLVANEDDRRIRGEEQFRSLREDCHVPPSRIRKARERLRENIM